MDHTAAAAFQALLRALHEDRDQAAHRYEEMRRRLHGFFSWRGARWPEELADETIDRVARRLAAGETIRTAEIGRYFLGVARNVLRESWPRESARAAQQALGPAAAAGVPDGESEARMQCLETCLGEMPEAERAVLLRYYEGQGGGRIEARRRLGLELGVPVATLRIRLHRLRVRLEACVRRCLARDETSSPREPLSHEGGRS
jgi:DNA-directed RNA polymerase specialized sigma24 family protein